MVAQRVGDEAVLRGDGLALRLPVAEVHPRPVHEDHGRTSALVDVGQVNAVHPELTHHRLLSLVSGGRAERSRSAAGAGPPLTSDAVTAPRSTAGPPSAAVDGSAS